MIKNDNFLFKKNVIILGIKMEDKMYKNQIIKERQILKYGY
jgi:hypothetical protein